MHARVGTYELPVDRLEDGIRGFREAADRIRDLEGLQEIFVLIDRETGQALTITIWDNAHSMTASRVAASRARSDAARSADGEVKSTREYEVVIHEQGAPADVERF